MLELSGIGDAIRLQKIGIQPRINLPAVGEHLTDHFLTRLTFELSEGESLNTSLSGLGLMKEIFRFVFNRKGAMTMPAGIVGGFVASRLAIDNNPDIQFHIAHASFANPAQRVFDPFPALSIGPCQLRPHSRGYSPFAAQTQNFLLKLTLAILQGNRPACTVGRNQNCA